MTFENSQGRQGISRDVYYSHNATEVHTGLSDDWSAQERPELSACSVSPSRRMSGRFDEEGEPSSSRLRRWFKAGGGTDRKSRARYGARYAC